MLRRKKPKLVWKLIKIKFKSLFGKPTPFRHIEIATTYDCNLNCQHCSAETLKSNEPKMTLEDYKKLGEECKKYGVTLVSFTGGEPFVDPRIEKIVTFFHPEETVIGFTTNGTLLSRERIKWLKKLGVDILIISLDSVDAKIHDEFRNVEGAFEKALRTIKIAKEEMDVMIIYTLHHLNISNDFLKMIKFAKRLGVDLHVSLMSPAGKWANMKSYKKFRLTISDKKLLDKLRKKHSFIVRDIDRNYDKIGCPAGTERISITPTGEAMPCTKIHVTFGNVKRDSLVEIRYRMLKHKEFFDSPPYCLCAEDNNFIERYIVNTWGRKKSLLPEDEFFRERDAGGGCLVCGNLNFLPFKDVKDYEYQLGGDFSLVKCSNCGIVKQQEIPDYSGLKGFYPDDYLVYHPTTMKRLGFFGFLKEKLYSGRAKKYAKLINSKGRILDVGCANCHLLTELKKQGNFELHGLDIKKLRDDYNELDIRFKEGCLERLKYPKNYFDLITMDNLIEHVPDPLLFMKKVYNILKPGGWVAGTTPNMRSLDAKIFGKYWGGYHIPRHLYIFSHDNLKRLLERTGFENISFPKNGNSGDWCVSVQNFLRRNEKKRRSYKRAWYFPYLAILIYPISFLLSAFKYNSVMDFQAQKIDS